MLRVNEESPLNGSGLSYYQIALHREWFNLIYGGSIQKLKTFLSLHDEEDCPNWVDSLGVTSLNYAILQGQIGAVRFLLNNGADINALDTLGRTPLMCAHYYIYHNYDAVKGYDMVDLLCDKKPNVNVIGAIGNTVLHLAADSGNEYLYNRFVAMGGNKDIVNNFGNTPKSLYEEAVKRDTMRLNAVDKNDSME